MKINEIFNKIYLSAKNCGYDIYVVGGYVRDKLIGRDSKDIDFVVVGEAMRFADQLKKDLHLRTLVRYPRFGTFMARYYGFSLEFVNAREESYENESRKPKTRQADLFTDLSRRDFTINTMAMDISPEKYGEITDIYDGRADLKKGIIKTPLEPLRTFSDDPLRMMRAIRFATRFQFEIEEKTYAAIGKVADRLTIISKERVRDEFDKIVLADKPSLGLEMLDESGLLEIFLPEITALKGVEQRQKYHHKDVFYHTLEVLDNIALRTDKPELRLAALFHDVAKPKTKRFVEGEGWTFHGHEVVGRRMAGGILKRMRYSSETVKYVKKLVSLHLRPMALVNEEVTDSAVRRLIFSAGEDIDDLMILCRADITSKNILKVKKYRENYDLVLVKITEVEKRDRLRNFQPPVNGNEIMQIFNLEPGPAVGKIKKCIEEAVLNGLVANEHEACLDYIIQHKGELIKLCG